jgi:hypothetical protein
MRSGTREFASKQGFNAESSENAELAEKQIMALRAVGDAAPNPTCWPYRPIHTARRARVFAFSANSAFSALSALNPLLGKPRRPRLLAQRAIANAHNIPFME